MTGLRYRFGTLGGALGLAGAVVIASAVAGAFSARADNCYNGVFPLNPYVSNCGLLPRPPRVIGSAPDQTALLNCSVGNDAFRAQCLSMYVNGGYGAYPGATLGPGYRP